MSVRGHSTPRAIAGYRAYHQMAVHGMPEQAIREAFDEGDLELIQEMVVKEYWKHVRSLLRKAPVFQLKLDEMAEHFRRPVEQILEEIMDAHFPEVTIAVTQMNHNKLRGWINEVYALTAARNERRQVQRFNEGGVTDADILAAGRLQDELDEEERHYKRATARVRARTPPMGADPGPDPTGFDLLEEAFLDHQDRQRDTLGQIGYLSNRRKEKIRKEFE